MKKSFIKAAVGALALTTMMGFACADGEGNFAQGNTYTGTWTVDWQYKDEVDPETGETVKVQTDELNTNLCQLANSAAFDWGNYDAAANDFIYLSITPHEEVDTTSISFGLNAFTSSWGGWQGIWGEDQQYILMGKVSDLLDMIKVEDIADFGGILVQITDDTYTEVGDQFDYVLKIMNSDNLFSSDNEYEFDVVVEEAYENGEPTGEPNDVLVPITNLNYFDWGNYYYNPDDVIEVTVTPGEGVDTSALQFGLNPFSSGWGGWTGVWTDPETGEYTLVGSMRLFAANNKAIYKDGFGGVNLQIVSENLEIGDEFNVKMSIYSDSTLSDITLDPEEPIYVDATKNFKDDGKDDISGIGKYTVPLHFSKDIWNDWCPAVVKLTKDGVDTYYVFAGKEVGWDITVEYDENDKSALIIPAKGDVASYKGDVPAVNVGDWVDVKAGESLSYDFPIDGAVDWSITFYSPAWGDGATMGNFDGEAKELPTTAEDGTAYTEVFVYAIGNLPDTSAVEPAPNGDTPATDDKKADDKKADTKTDSTSPKTADGTSVAILSLVSILALAGVVVTKKNRA